MENARTQLEGDGEVVRIGAARTPAQMGLLIATWRDGRVTVHSEEDDLHAFLAIPAPAISPNPAPTLVCFVDCEAAEGAAGSARPDPSRMASCSGSNDSDAFSSADSSPRHSLIFALVDGQPYAWQVAASSHQLRFSPLSLVDFEPQNANLASVRHLASFRDTCAMVTAKRQLQFYRASVFTSSSGSLCLQLTKSRSDVTLPEECTCLSVSELAVWVAGETRLHVIKQHMPTAPLISIAVALQQRIRKLVALCCMCVIGTDGGDVLLVAMRCCPVAGQLLTVAKVDLTTQVAALDAFQSSIVTADATGHGLVFSCMAEARSNLLKMAAVASQPQQQQLPLLAIDPKLATLIADTVLDIAILSPRSVALLYSKNIT